MKTYQKITKLYRSLLTFGLILILSAIFLSACSSEVDLVEKPDHVVVEPSTLNEGDSTLTLEGYGALGALMDTDLTVADMLMYAAQDEYLARGEYLAIIAEFGNQNPYVNIVKAEETHLEFLKDVYLALELEFPEDTSADHLLIPTDLLEAARTGVQAEIDNIAMYELFLSNNLPESVVEVFTALKNGSESHLLAFQKQVDRLSN